MNAQQAIVSILLALAIIFTNISMYLISDEIEQLRQEKISGWGNE